MSKKPDHSEEFAAQDDAIIGKAVKGSAFVLLGIVVIVVGVILYINRPQEDPEEVITEIVAPEQRLENTADMPVVSFVDITESAGITFVHNNGAAGEKLLPESLGGGVAFFDFDMDGDQDLFFVNSTWWKWDLESDTSRTPTVSRLYRNDTEAGESIRFTDVTEGSGLDVAIFGMGCAVGDYDNDSDPDIYITAVGSNYLFQNMGNGTFNDVSSTSQTSGNTQDWSTAATFLDINNDGLLDLFVGNYVRWSKEIDFEVNFTIDGSTRAYGPPTDFEGAFSQLYLNQGDGSFSDISQQAGIEIRNRATEKPASKTLGVAPFDFNSDGWVDIMVANDTVQNLLFINNQDGTFKERGALSGVGFDSNGNTRGAMGIDVAQFRNNEDVGIAIGNFSNEMTSLYVTQGQSLLYADEAIAEGIGPTSRLPLKFGIFFWDYDLDGWMDLLSVNGHLDVDIVKLQQSQKYKQPALLYWNRQGNGFSFVDAEKAPGGLFQPIVGRGCAYADLDKDGDLDLVFSQLHGPPLLLRNDQSLGHNWLQVKVLNQHGSPALGSKIVLETEESFQTSYLTSTRGYLSQSETIVTFGLGNQKEIKSVRVVWPGGESQVWTPENFDLSVNRLISVQQEP